MRKRETDLVHQFNSCEDSEEQQRILEAVDIFIGSRVLIGPDVKIYTTFHPTHTAKRFTVSEEENYFKTRAKAVSKDISDDVIAVRNPCKVIRENR